jgi:predicted RNA methylase
MKKQTTGIGRNTVDKFYTKPDVVELCESKIREHLNISYERDLIIEPSAGNGAFISRIKTLTKHYKFYDIEPENVEILKQDYLELDGQLFVDRYQKIHCIGNPPFGRQSSTAIQFIKKSATFCDSISFILPKSFKKDSLKKHFPLKFHLLYEIDIPYKSFLVDGKEHDVPCVFQIWKKMDYSRDIVQKIDPLHFIFVNKVDNPDISFIRVGVKAGTIDNKNIDEKNVQSHYFIKFTNGKSVQENIDSLKPITYDFNNTVGPKSISKQELICKFNPLLQ